MKKRLIVLSSVLSLTPIWALAANATCSSNLLTPIEGVICTIGKILNTVIPVLIVLGVLYFVWGVVAYVIGND